MEISEKFEKYAALLREWNGRMNLVAPSTLSEIESRHFDDSAQLAEYIPHDASVIDLGSGAGFPGVVLAILGYNVTCTESVAKKTGFLMELKRELGLSNLTIFHGRVEDYLKKHRISADRQSPTVFTARAFAPLIKILDMVFPYKNRLFLLKGRQILDEIRTANAKYDFGYELFPSKTGDGFVAEIYDLRIC
ncbi:MAG: 16S rRNA (guanine(527)-N(7))-methyltransferase RsmG [Proteobacteria bacterium]|nr:16S rRNA (guanine(527)-N(7))-methyltransferase RsmG [Pseudomonadota bacterium]